MPRTAVIMPCYNGTRYLPDAVDSVRRQSDPDWELILVDDGSTDGTPEMARRFAAEDSRIRLIQQPNGRQSRARNNGAAHASAIVRYLYFLDQDDLLHPDALRILGDYLDQHPMAGMVSSEKSDMTHQGEVLPETPARRWAPGFLGFPRILKPSDTVTPFATYFCGTGAGLWVLYRREVFEAVGGWDAEFQGFEDNDLMAKVALEFEAHHVPDVLCYWRRHENQTSRDHEKMGSMYHRFRAKWDAFVPANPKQSAKLRAARRFHCLWHEPGRHFRICIKTLPALINGPRSQAWWWFRTNLASGVSAFIRGLQIMLLGHRNR